MNILFLTLLKIDTLETRGIYHDLMREFSSHGHNIYIISPTERRENKPSSLSSEGNVHFLNVRTLNVQKTNIIEKGFATLSIEHLFLRGVKKYFSNVKFDLVLYSTPPITFTKVIDHVKKKDGAKSYLLLKDIFPQNAVDMKIMSKKGFIYQFFRKKEHQLYKISDTIGCMSQANVEFLLQHNPKISPNKVEVNPNTIEPVVFNYSDEQKREIRKKYQIPTNKKVFVYGGNLGKPQGLDLLETIEATKLEEAFFLIVGDGTEFSKIQEWFNTTKPNNAKLLQRLPKEDYDQLLAACDIGLIFLDKNFLIPNFPSRLLSYLEMKIPVIAATDVNTDIGDVIEQANCGYKVTAGNQNEMQTKLKTILNDDLQILGDNAEKLLLKKYTVDKSYHLIMKKI